MISQRLFLSGLFLLFLALAAQAAERRGTLSASNHVARRGAAPLLSGKPIAPVAAPETPKGAGWNGAYFGVNGGAATGASNR